MKLPENLMNKRYFWKGSSKSIVKEGLSASNIDDHKSPVHVTHVNRNQNQTEHFRIDIK